MESDSVDRHVIVCVFGFIVVVVVVVIVVVVVVVVTAQL